MERTPTNQDFGFIAFKMCTGIGSKSKELLTISPAWDILSAIVVISATSSASTTKMENR